MATTYLRSRATFSDLQSHRSPQHFCSPAWCAQKQSIRSEVHTRRRPRSKGQQQLKPALFFRRDKTGQKKTLSHSFSASFTAARKSSRDCRIARNLSPPPIRLREKKYDVCDYTVSPNTDGSAARHQHMLQTIAKIRAIEHKVPLYDWKAELGINPQKIPEPQSPVDELEQESKGIVSVWRPDAEEDLEAKRSAQISRSRAAAAIKFVPDAITVVAAMEGKRFEHIDKNEASVREIRDKLVAAQFPNSQVHHSIPAVTLMIMHQGVQQGIGQTGVAKPVRVPATRPQGRLRTKEDKQAWEDSLTVEGRVKLMREFSRNSKQAKADRKAANIKKKEMRKRAAQRERSRKEKQSNDKMLSQALLRSNFKL